MISADSLRLTDIDVAIDELRYFKDAGGHSLVEQSTRWVDGDPAVLRQISEATGINIIAASAYYETPPAYIDTRTIDQLADELVKEVMEGFEGIDIKAGIIGEMITSWPLNPREEKALRAAARAQLQTGAALSIHPSCWDKEALALLDIVESEGVDLQRVVICHLDHVMDVEYHKRVAARGAYVEYDRCGIERYGGDLERNLKLFPRDPERVVGIVELISSGYLDRILLSHDICMKIELKRYAGPGYGHILRHIVPMMRRAGVSEADIDTILVENPKRMLAF
jgi:phosphotriesterase-related protein